APLAYGQSADVAVRVFGRELLGPSLGAYIFVEVDNHGPNVASNIVVTGTTNGGPAQFDCGTSCTFNLPPDGMRTVAILLPTPLQFGETFDLTAKAVADTPDPNPDNNAGTAHVTWSDAPDLFVQLQRNDDDSDPGLPFSGQVMFGNYADYPAHDVVI